MNPDKWLITRTRYIPAIYPLLSFFDWDCAKFFGIQDSGHIINAWDNGDYFAIWEKQKISGEFADKALEMLIKVDDLNKLRLQSTKSGEALVSFCKEFAEAEAGITIERYIEFLNILSDKYAALMRDNMCYWLFAPAALERRVRSLLSGHSEENVTEILRTISHPVEQSYSQTVDQEFMRITAMAREKGLADSEVVKKIKKFSHKYFWFPYEYVGPDIWDEVSVIKKIQIELNKPASNKHKDESGETAEDVILKYNLGEEIIKFSAIWQILTLLQDDRKMYNAQVCYYLNEVITKKISAAFSVSFEEARYLNSEALAALQGGREAFGMFMKKRMEFFIVDNINGQDIPYSSSEARNYLTSLGIKLKEDILDIKEVKGQIAFKGKVIGRVRVLKTSQVNDFKDGDIIVTGMTTPILCHL